MLGYIIRRLVAAFMVVVMTSMIVFALFFWGPSNPAASLCNEGGRCTAERQTRLENAMGLNDSVFSQYGVWAKGLFVDRTVKYGAEYHCDAPCLGISFRTKAEVRKELMDKYPATLSVAIGGASLYLLIGVTLGVLAARVRGSITDRSLVASSLVLGSIPYYIVALLAWLYLVNSWGVFPQTGYNPITENPIKWAAGLLLPWLVLGLWSSTQYARFGRGAMLDTLGEDYIRTATAKGVRSSRVVFQHALRAAIVPIVTIFGLDVAALLAGTIFTERIFEIDGIGNWGLRAINQADFPIITATVLVGAVLVVVANLVVDILYSFLDPRVRLA
jgi:peptide/nickel transport system permease protein